MNSEKRGGVARGGNTRETNGIAQEGVGNEGRGNGRRERETGDGKGRWKVKSRSLRIARDDAKRRRDRASDRRFSPNHPPPSFLILK